MPYGLVMNYGGSSLKCRLYSLPDLNVTFRAQIDGLGSGSAILRCWNSDGTLSGPHAVVAFNAPQGTEVVFDKLLAEGGPLSSLRDLRFVAHKLAHGGLEYRDPAIIDADMITALEKWSTVVPIHNGASLVGIRAVAEVAPDVVQVGVFETWFHRTIPDYAAVYGLPHKLCEEHSLRKFGFHGASHRYVASRMRSLIGVDAEDLRLISCHLGSGTSVAAILNGRSVEISSGFTPQSGTIMSTRAGDFDAEVLMYLLSKRVVTLDRLRPMLEKESGIYGISGVSGDLKEVMDAANAGNARAELAVQAFCYRVKQYIGVSLIALNGVDVIAFTGGIGERSAEVRERICSGLGFVGVTLDKDRNNACPGEGVISADNSSVRVVTLQTDEEYIVARDALGVVGLS
jgi:acetate kinase